MVLEDLEEIALAGPSLTLRSIDKRKYLYTDASLGDAPQIGGALLPYEFEGLPAGAPAFSQRLKPAWLTDMCRATRLSADESIAAYELFAVLVAMPTLLPKGPGQVKAHSKNPASSPL